MVRARQLQAKRVSLLLMLKRERCEDVPENAEVLAIVTAASGER